MTDDTIRRQAAVDTVEQMYKACEGSLSDYHDLLVAAFMDLTPAHGDGDTISRAAALNCVYGTSPNKIKGRISELPSAQTGWIPVTERLPEIGQLVLCSLKTRHYYGRIHVCKYCAADKYYDHPYFDWSHNGFPDVVAWMPLPKPWEGDANG